MPITNPKYPFTIENVNDHASDLPGVYGLNMGNETIYYGSSERSVQSRLLDHLAGREGPCTQSASEFASELFYQPLVREAELLKEHVATYGELPRCNNVLP